MPLTPSDAEMREAARCSSAARSPLQRAARLRESCRAGETRR